MSEVGVSPQDERDIHALADHMIEALIPWMCKAPGHITMTALIEACYRLAEGLSVPGRHKQAVQDFGVAYQLFVESNGGWRQ